MAETKIGGSETRRRLLELIRSRRRPGAPRLARAFPLAFPIADVTYEVSQRLPEPIGLVQRYALDALCRFGPCTAADLDELLGLGPDLARWSWIAWPTLIPASVSPETRSPPVWRVSSESRPG